MPRFVPKRQEQIFADMLPRVVVQAGLTDVVDTSGVKSILQAVARALDEAYWNMFLLQASFSLYRAEGADLDARALDIGGTALTRRQAVAATGTVIFSRASGSGTVAIDTSTLVATADGTTFQVTAQGNLTDTTAPSVAGHTVGQDSGAIPIVATSAGVSGNVAAATITKLQTRPTGVDSVVNLAATVGGQDVETDDAFRARIFAYIAALPRATAQSITSAVLGAQDSASGRTITFAKIIEDAQNPGFATLLVDDGTGQAATTAVVSDENLTLGKSGPPPDSAVGGERRFTLKNVPVNPNEQMVLTSSLRGTLASGVDYTFTPSYGQILLTSGALPGEVLTASYTYYTGLIAVAQRIVQGDPQDPSMPGYRAAGVVVDVRTPQAITTNVVAVLTIASGYDPASVELDVVSGVTSYINALGIGDDIQRANIIQAAMNVDGVANVTLTSPATDIPVLDDQIARIAAANVTVA